MKEYTLQKSKKPDKKYSITDGNKTIHFGAKGYDDYTTHKDPKRRILYDKRHKKRENWSDPSTPGFWAKWILWNKPTLLSSIADAERRFGIKIISR